jgi:hypothetical protein
MVNKKYRHYKGGLYQVISKATMESSGEEMVVYFSLQNYKHWIRPVVEFEAKFALEIE